MGHKDQRGFSMLEIIVILAIITIVFCIAIPSYEAIAGDGQKDKCDEIIKDVMHAEEIYYVKNGEHSTEYLTNDYVDADADIVVSGIITSSEVKCPENNTSLKWTNENGETILTCDLHID